MITINGQKMGKSLGNFITLGEFFSGSHKDKDGNEMLDKAYSPMTIRFFILQAHYRSTVDFSNEALQASEKGLAKIVETYNRLMKLRASDKTTVDVAGLRERCEEAMCDDLNTPIVISHLFEAAKAVNTVADGKGTISQADLDELQSVFRTFVCDILGIQVEEQGSGSSESYRKAVDLLLSIRQQAKQNKDWATSDRIRNELAAIGFNVKDTKDGFEWELAD